MGPGPVATGTPLRRPASRTKVGFFPPGRFPRAVFIHHMVVVQAAAGAVAGGRETLCRLAQVTAYRSDLACLARLPGVCAAELAARGGDGDLIYGDAVSRSVLVAQARGIGKGVDGFPERPEVPASGLRPVRVGARGRQRQQPGRQRHDGETGPTGQERSPASGHDPDPRRPRTAGRSADRRGRPGGDPGRRRPACGGRRRGLRKGGRAGGGLWCVGCRRGCRRVGR